MKENSRNIRLGLFVIAGTAALVIALYFIGSKQNLFGSTFHISAHFDDVDGLMKGNNVRFAGIDVGTVESVEIVSDTSVNVVMIIKKKVQRFIKKNALVSIGTDGLMGNKLVNIKSVKDAAPTVQQGDILATLQAVEMDEMVRTLNVTNNNIKAITTNLKSITEKINSKNSLWSLLMDTVIAENVKASMVNLKLISNQAILVTGNLNSITADVRNGKGTIGALITDTALSAGIRQTIVKLHRLSDTAAVITGNLSQVATNLKQGKGSAGILLNDTTMVHSLNKSLSAIEKGASNFNQNMEALKHSWPFKKYFRKQQKKQTYGN